MELLSTHSGWFSSCWLRN